MCCLFRTKLFQMKLATRNKKIAIFFKSEKNMCVRAGEKCQKVEKNNGEHYTTEKKCFSFPPTAKLLLFVI